MKKFVRIICTLGGCLAVAVVTFYVVLMLCPGLSIFGIRYVGFVQEDKQGVQQLQPILSGKNVEINTNEMPTDIVFSTDGAAYVKYKQSFMGFTSTKADVEYVSVTNSNGKYLVKVNDPETFVYSTNRLNGYLTVVLPASVGNLSLVGQNASISLSGSQLKVNNLSISTLGNIAINNKIVANQVELKNGTINISNVINSSNTIKINTGKSVSISKNESASFDISASGNVNVSSCVNLNVLTKTGSVKIPDTGYVSGSLNISTTSGKVCIGKVYGSATISSQSGDVAVNDSNKLNVETVSGDVKITQTKIANIVTKSGNVNCSTILSNANIQTTTGNVNLSANGVNSKICNVQAETTKGNIVAYNLCGETCALGTEWGAVKVLGADVDRLKLSSLNTSVQAEKISCVSVQVVSDGIIDLNFDNVADSVNIVGGNRTIDVAFADSIEYDCWISASSDNAEFVVDGKKVEGTNYKRASVKTDAVTVKINTKNGNVNVK